MSVRVRFSSDKPDIAYVGAAYGSSARVGSLLSQFLLKPMPKVLSDPDFVMDACTAASLGDEQTLKEIYKRNPSALGRENSNGWTPLQYAAYLGHLGACAYLLSTAGNMEGTNNRGQTALMLASTCGKLNVVRLLIENGANVHHCDVDNRQALHYATSCSQNMIVDVLLLAGADPNARDNLGRTPVHEAAVSGHELTILSLLEKGGNVELRTKNGETALDLVIDNCKLYEILVNHIKKNSELEENTSEVTSNGTRCLTTMLEDMQLGKFAEKFKREGIDIDLFFDLKERDLDEMHIPFGPKKKMLYAIERYNKTGNICVEPMETVMIPNSPPSTTKLINGIIQINKQNEAKAELIKTMLRPDQQSLTKMMDELLEGLRRVGQYADQLL